MAIKRHHYFYQCFLQYLWRKILAKYQQQFSYQKLTIKLLTTIAYIPYNHLNNHHYLKSV